MPTGTPNQPQRCCRNCGIQVMPENAFCTSCGASLNPRTEGSDQTHPRPTPSPGRPGSFIDVVRTAFQRTISGSGGAFSVYRGSGDLRGMPQRAMRWFKDLPAIPKAVLVGLVLSVLLSPLARFAALLLFGVSVIALIVRARQRRSTGRWPIVAVASLVLALVFAGVSDALYGDGLLGNSEATSNESVRAARENAGKSKDEPYNDEDSSYSEKTSPGKEYEDPVDVYLVHNDRILLPGSVLVNRKSSNYLAVHLSGDPYDLGHAQPNGIMVSEDGIMRGSKVGDLDRLDYACTYDADDPRDTEAAQREACGFSIELDAPN